MVVGGSEPSGSVPWKFGSWVDSVRVGSVRRVGSRRSKFLTVRLGSVWISPLQSPTRYGSVRGVSYDSRGGIPLSSLEETLFV